MSAPKIKPEKSRGTEQNGLEKHMERVAIALRERNRRELNELLETIQQAEVLQLENFLVGIRDCAIRMRKDIFGTPNPSQKQVREFLEFFMRKTLGESLSNQEYIKEQIRDLPGVTQSSYFWATYAPQQVYPEDYGYHVTSKLVADSLEQGIPLLPVALLESSRIIQRGFIHSSPRGRFVEMPYEILRKLGISNKGADMGVWTGSLYNTQAMEEEAKMVAIQGAYSPVIPLHLSNTLAMCQRILRDEDIPEHKRREYAKDLFVLALNNTSGIRGAWAVLIDKTFKEKSLEKILEALKDVSDYILHTVEGAIIQNMTASSSLSTTVSRNPFSIEELAVPSVLVISRKKAWESTPLPLVIFSGRNPKTLVPFFSLSEETIIPAEYLSRYGFEDLDERIQKLQTPETFFAEARRHLLEIITERDNYLASRSLASDIEKAACMTNYPTVTALDPSVLAQWAVFASGGK